MTKSLFLFALFLYTLQGASVPKDSPKFSSIPQREVSYSGYQVIRLTKGTQQTKFSQTAKLVQIVASAHNLDVWAANEIQGWIDVMIPPELVNSTSVLFQDIPFTVSIADVEESIVASELDRLASRQTQDFFTDFQYYGTIIDFLLTFVTRFPNKAERIVVGQTYNGNDIFALHLGKENGVTKQKFVIHCGIHAREWITPSTCCWIIDQLVAQDPDGEELLSFFEYIIIPVLNVDGYDYTHTTNRLWRKNRQPNAGSTCIGTDLNRNFAYGWSGPGASNNPCSETFYGSQPFSGTEAAVVRNLLSRYTADGTLISYWDLHAYGSLWMSAWGYTCNSLPTDFPLMQATMRDAVTAVRAVNGNTYSFGSICQTIYQASGSSVDHAYGNEGVIHAYTSEAFGNSFTPPVSYIPLVGSETYAGVKATILAIKQDSLNKASNKA